MEEEFSRFNGSDKEVHSSMLIEIKAAVLNMLVRKITIASVIKHKLALQILFFYILNNISATVQKSFQIDLSTQIIISVLFKIQCS